VLHGCTIESGVLVGMGAVVMNGAHIGSGSIIAAGSVVLEGTRVPERSLVAGVPAKVRRETTDDEVASIAYRERARAYDSQG
jgi:carbonic anhydrase/acetyltransferase-like protein (isoleucine patch superfamily)